MERWIGRVALVTGASSGIGAALCKVLVKEGLKVVGCARNVDRINKLSDELKAENLPGSLCGIRCDLSKEDDILKMFEDIKKNFNRLDICVNNAGLAFDAPLLTGKTEQWQHMFDVNVMALHICVRESWKLMQAAAINDGHFVHINTSYSFGKPVANSSHYYAATKMMVKTLGELQKKELESLNSKARVSQVSPGIVQTEFLARKVNEETAQKVFKEVTSLQPEDVANAVLYVLGAPAYVNVDHIVLNPVNMN